MSQQSKLNQLKKEFDELRKNNDHLLAIIDQAEISESVYNSNAIENSTLTLLQTEQILENNIISRFTNLREVYEAKNLAKINRFFQEEANNYRLNKQLILKIHQMLMENIDDSIGGRFRKRNEYVRVGSHIAADPRKIDRLISELLASYHGNIESHFLDKIAHFHLQFEHIHPFNDGNGRIGRSLINFQLIQLGLPPVIIRNKSKQKYYQAFREYDLTLKTSTMEKVLFLAISEALHKRITYLKKAEIVNVTKLDASGQTSNSALLNKALRQTIPAFRERGVWKIGVENHQHNEALSILSEKTTMKNIEK